MPKTVSKNSQTSVRSPKPARLDGYFVTLLGGLILAYITIFTYLFANYHDFLAEKLSFWFLIVAFLVDGVKVIAESFADQSTHPIKTDETKVTVLVPSYNGQDTISQTVKQIRKSLKKSRIIVIDDGSTDQSAKLAKKAGAEVLSLKTNVGKVAAIHEGLKRVKTPYVLIMDDDTVLECARIPTNLLKNFDAVAFRVLPIGEGVFNHLQRHEYRKSMEINRSFHNGSGTIPCVSGAIGLFRKDALVNQLSKHSGEFSGEDLQRTLLIHLDHNNRGVAFVDQPVYTHVPTTLRHFYLQRTHGWWPGLWNNLKYFWKLAWAPETPGALRYEMFYALFLIFTDPLRILALPALLSSFPRFIAFYLFYLLLEFIPYLKMGSRESIFVVLLAPIYGLINLFTRVLGFFAWVFRRLVSVGKFKQVPDAYKQAPLAHQLFAFVVGGLASIGLLVLGSYPMAHQSGLLPNLYQQIVSPP